MITLLTKLPCCAQKLTFGHRIFYMRTLILSSGGLPCSMKGRAVDWRLWLNIGVLWQ